MDPAQAQLLRREEPTATGYAAAMHDYQQQFMCHKVDAACIAAAVGEQSDPTFAAMCGNKLFSSAGQLATWDSAGLVAGEAAALPVLLTRGDSDEVSSANTQALAARLPNAQVAEFSAAGSFAHIDAWEPWLERLNDHLTAAEKQSKPSA